MTVGERLKQLRKALPRIEGKEVGVRAVAAAMGYPQTPNAYGYYESAGFPKEELPLDKARLIAEAFAKLGGDRESILELAGIGGDELAGELARAEASAPVPVQIMMPVNLPSAEALIAMFRTMLVGAEGRDPDEIARRLAQGLPGGLSRALNSRPSEAQGEESARDASPQPPAKPRHEAS